MHCDEDTKEARADAEVTADNLKYFGDPVYEYGLAQAMEDGYLAACEIQLAQVNLDATGVTLADIVARNPRNANTGQPLTAAEIAAVYEKTDFETKLLLPDRVNAMCLDLFYAAAGLGCGTRATPEDHHLLRPRPSRGRCGGGDE